MIEAKVATREEKNPLVLVALVDERLVTKAFVVVELPTIRLVIEARVATRDEMKELVEVELVEERSVTKALDVELLVIDAFVAVRLVVVAEVIRAFVL